MPQVRIKNGLDWLDLFRASTCVRPPLNSWATCMRRLAPGSANRDRTFIRFWPNIDKPCRVENALSERRDAMATKAYILIRVKAGRTKEVLQSLKKLAGI